MEMRTIGRTGVKISPIGVGCWQFGDAEWGGMTQQEVDRTVRQALELGVNLFDNAEVYGGGASEEMLGKALAGVQDQPVILGKLRGANLAPDRVEKALDASLKRMKRDRIDIYLIHWPVDNIPVADTLGALARLKKSGKVRAIGISNYTGKFLVDALKTGMVDVVENCYNLLWRYLDHGLRDECQRLGTAIIAYSPLAQGILTGKLGRDAKFGKSHTRGINRLYKGAAYQKSLDVTDILLSLTGKYSRRVPEIALNWTVYRPGITAALVGARKAEYILSAANAVGWSMDVADSVRLAEAGMAVDAMFDTSLPMWEPQPLLEHANV